ncbi:MAG TPA: ferredoxin reductase, partial [Gaiellaceae bacterium]
MAGTAVLGRLRAPLAWRLAELVEHVPEAAGVKTLVLDVPDWPGHAAGQHVDVRLTAEDGYQAQRSYSIASSPGSERLELTVERLEDGEVSPFLTDVLEPGDRFELRGPVGGYFVWDPASPGPLHLVGGGSGVVPLMAMLRHRRRAMPELDMRLIYSVRSADDVIFAGELGPETLLTYTRRPPADWDGHTGRLDAALVAAAGPLPATAFVCGSHGFV